MSQPNNVPERRCLVDTFESFFGERIERLSEDNVRALPKDGLEKLVYQVDSFLKEAQTHDYPPEAVMLDSTSNPLIFAKDPSLPTTTIKAKQVALMHKEVVIPMQPLGIDFRCARSLEESFEYPVAWFNWTQKNHVLLRKHVFSITGHPLVSDIVRKDAIPELVTEIQKAIRSFEFRALKFQLLGSADLTREDEDKWISDSVFCMLMDAINANLINGNLAFLDENSGVFYENVFPTAKDTPQVPSPSDIQVLKSLHLPKIETMPDNEFVAIRTQAEDFEEFRQALSRVIGKTQLDVSRGRTLQSAFQSNLDEIHLRAEMLRREIKDKSIRQFFRKNIQTITLGAVTSTSAAAVSDFASGNIRPVSLMARFLSTVSMATLLAAVFYKAPGRQSRLLKFYNVLLGA